MIARKLLAHFELQNNALAFCWALVAYSTIPSIVTVLQLD